MQSKDNVFTMFLMEHLTAYRMQIETGTDDSAGVLLLSEGKLVACLIRLDDACHGKDRGQWFVEFAFGFSWRETPRLFADLDAAAESIGESLFGAPSRIGAIRELR